MTITTLTDMLTALRRIWPRRRDTPPITMGTLAVGVPQPIRLAEYLPDDVAWFGIWDDEEGHWLWWKRGAPHHWHTHWLPIDTKALPARCCAPDLWP